MRIARTWVLAACVSVLASTASAFEVFVDNNDSGFSFTGLWTTSTVTTGGLYFGSNFLTHRGSQGAATAKWQPSLPLPDNYEVFVRHTTGSSRTTAAQFIVDYDGGSQTVNVDQTTNGGQWISIGTFPFVAGTSGSVRLIPDTGSLIFTVADAVKWVSQAVTPTRSTTWGRVKALYR